MKLFAYYRQDHNSFALFFNHYNTVQRVVVENIHGLRDILFTNPELIKLNNDSKEEAKELLDEILHYNILPKPFEDTN